MHSLKAYTTLGVEQSCSQLISADSRARLIHACLSFTANPEEILILGGGSNLVFTKDFIGTVIRVCSKGIRCSEDKDYYRLEVEAGENWHQLVTMTVTKGMAGLENLALIPGSVGAAPIQNIGAYGMEFASVCDWVEYFDRQDGQIKRLAAADCQFGYRDSIFKNALQDRAVILAVGIKLAKDWQANLAYQPLGSLRAADGTKKVTPRQIYDRVCSVRRAKLPDPARIGNVGSFFKNPLISQDHYQTLLKQFPGIVAFPQKDNSIKLAAAWLIDTAGLKAATIGDAAVYPSQALVIINRGKASGLDVYLLAEHIINRILDEFAIRLEIEPKIC